MIISTDICRITIKLHVMERTKNTSNSKTKALLTIIAIFSTLLFISSLIFHLTPLGMIEYVEDFAVHHYFLMGFISLFVLAASTKAFSAFDEKIDRNYRESTSLELSKNRRKRLKLLNLFNNKKPKADEDESCFVKTDEISKLSFAQADVLIDEEARSRRQRDVQKATTLGNSYKQKILILFRDDETKKHLITTIWQSTSDHINLKGGIILPVKSIYKIEF